MNNRRTAPIEQTPHMFSTILAKVNNYREIIFPAVKNLCDDAVNGFVETDISFMYQSMTLERRKEYLKDKILTFENLLYVLIFSRYRHLRFVFFT